MFLYENNHNHIPTMLVKNVLLFLFCPVIETKYKKQVFEQVAGLVTRNSFAFCL